MALKILIRVEPLGKTIEAPRKSNLLRAIQDAGIPIGSSCGGKGVCGSCKIIVIEGHENLSDPTDVELDLKERNGLTNQDRISCQTMVFGDITITTNYW